MLVRQLLESDHVTWVGNGGLYFQLLSEAPDVQEYALKRVMDDTVYATLTIRPSDLQHEYVFSFSGENAPYTKVQQRGDRFRAPSRKMAAEYALKWATGLANNFGKDLAEDLAADIRKARQAKSNATKTVWLHRLNKDGNESGMADARTYFNTEVEAKEHHDRLVKLNPKKHIAHRMYSDVGDETMKVDFVNGKTQHAPGGLTNDDDGALDNFMQWLDDQGSAASMWMPEHQQEQLFKLYQNGYKVKCTGMEMSDKAYDAGTEDPRIQRHIDKWQLKGWTLFASEENGGYVDMVFTKAK